MQKLWQHNLGVAWHAPSEARTAFVEPRDCKDKVREVPGECLMRLVRFLDPMYADAGEALRSKAALALAHLATGSEANAQTIVRLGGFLCKPLSHGMAGHEVTRHDTS